MDGGGGTAGGEGFGREGCAVDAVLADAAADDDDVVADLGGFFPAGFAVDFFWDEADGASEDEGFAFVAVVENDEALRCGNAAAVTARIDASDDTFEDAFGA